MVNRGQQLRVERKVERLFTSSCGRPVAAYLRKLEELGFTQTAGDPAALQFENPSSELFVEIQLDPDGCVHSYQVLTFPERNARQQKVRW